jgi:hypothetical protein
VSRAPASDEFELTVFGAEAHGDMLLAPFGHACLPNLDYYDNRTPRREKACS